MEKTTVRATETKLVSAKDLFSLSFGTNEMYTPQKIANIKRKFVDLSKSRLATINFFENDDVQFFVSKEKETEGSLKGKEFAIIDYIKDYNLTPLTEFWKFGFVDKKTHQITLLFGGHSIAKDKIQAIKYYEIAKAVAKKSPDLIPFAFKD